MVNYKPPFFSHAGEIAERHNPSSQRTACGGR
jgi:hypothetical protein